MRQARYAVVLLVAGALARALAPLLPVLEPARDPAPAAVAAAVLAPLLPALLVLLLARRRADSGAPTAAVLAAAAVAPAVLLGDLALVVTPAAAARPELGLPTGLVAVRPGVGSGVLLAGDVLLVLAAVAALLARWARDGDGAEPDPGRPGIPVLGGLLAALGLMVAPFTGSGALLARGALDAPAPTGPAAGLLALTVLLGSFGAGVARAPIRAAALGGLALAAGAVAAPTLLASAVTPGLAVSSGPLLVLAGAAVLGLAALADRARSRDDPAPAGSATGDTPVRERLLARAPGIAALLTAATATVAATAPTLAWLPGAPVADGAGSGRSLLLPAAAVLVVPGLLVALGPPRLSARGRPVLSVVWAAVPFAAGPTLDDVLAATDAGGPLVGVGPGGTAAVVALALAVVTAVVAAVAGAAERRGAGLGDTLRSRPGTPGAAGPGGPDPGGSDAGGAGEPDSLMLRPAAPAAVLAVPGFGGPLLRDALGGAGRAWDGASATSWGGLVAMIVVAAVLLLVPRTRPARALALCAGTAAVVLVRLSALVFTPPRPGEQAGAGTWAAALCLAAVVGTAAVAWTRVRHGVPPRGPDAGPDITGPRRAPEEADGSPAAPVGEGGTRTSGGVAPRTDVAGVAPGAASAPGARR